MALHGSPTHFRRCDRLPPASCQAWPPMALRGSATLFRQREFATQWQECANSGHSPRLGEWLKSTRTGRQIKEFLELGSRRSCGCLTRPQPIREAASSLEFRDHGREFRCNCCRLRPRVLIGWRPAPGRQFAREPPVRRSAQLASNGNPRWASKRSRVASKTATQFGEPNGQDGIGERRLPMGHRPVVLADVPAEVA
jgi:hypothetical protein